MGEAEAGSAEEEVRVLASSAADAGVGSTLVATGGEPTVARDAAVAPDVAVATDAAIAPDAGVKPVIKTQTKQRDRRTGSANEDIEDRRK